MRSKALFKSAISHKRRLYGKRSKRRRFPLRRKYTKKSPKYLSNYRNRRYFRKNRSRKVDESKAKDNAQDLSPNIDELIENMDLLQL